MSKETLNQEMLEFGRNLKYLREGHKMSRSALAPKLHISPKTLGKLEEGIFCPRLSTQAILRAASFFEIAPSMLFSPVLRGTHETPSGRI